MMPRLQGEKLASVLTLVISLITSSAVQAQSWNSDTRVYTKFYVQVYDRGFPEPQVRKGILFFRDLMDAYAWKPAGEYAGSEGRYIDLKELESLRSLPFGLYYCEKGHYIDLGRSYIGIAKAGQCRPVSREELSQFGNKFKRTY